MLNGRAALWLDALRTQLWPLPVLAVAAAVALGVALPALDSSVDGQLPDSVTAVLFSGGPEAARAVLQAIAGSLITVTSLTFSLTVVTLQLASSQFSPRLLRTFTADRFVHGTLALFLAAFAFALAVLRSIRGEASGKTAFVPEISVTVAFALALASVVGLVLFLAHLTREIRVETMMRRVGGETRETIDRVFPKGRPSEGVPPVPQPGSFPVTADSSGFLTSLDKDGLLAAALNFGAVVRIDRDPGSSMVEGVPFATAWPVEPGEGLGPEAREELCRDINAAVVTGFERTRLQDVGFGFRQLADVAARSMSPGINDPTTAVHVLGHLSALLCRLVDRDPGPEQICDDDGRVRVVVSLPSLPALVDLAVNQARNYGAGDADVAQRLLDLLHEVAYCDPKGLYRDVILDHLDRMRAAIAAAGYSAPERRRLLDRADASAVEVQVRPET
ncbi:putative membrane protein [Pseudarthrobacter defluvii]|uniref:DUF2254 domain-containing protein n=1 Tax=Pseudarthrobacter defluvii TaxID=410837 RepID=UPI0027863E65|nr:DUF2254 domain-containing protein [Pseudarthrobacter defluvii]MDQ0768049.1 putative membrane protein [Pseudarthrobacter defluvii]